MTKPASEVLDAVEQAIAHMTRQEAAALSELIAARLNECTGRTLLTSHAAFEPILTADELAILEQAFAGRQATVRDCWNGVHILTLRRVPSLPHIAAINLGKQLSSRYASEKRGPQRYYLITATEARAETQPAIESSEA